MEQRHIAVLYHYIAHYRAPIFDLLTHNRPVDNSSSNTYCYRIYSGSLSNDDYLKVNNNTQDNSVSIKNIWLGKHFLWQRGAIHLALDKNIDTLILLGNMYYLSNWLIAIVARLNRKKVLMWTHGVRRSSGMRERMRVLFYRLADGLLLYGHRAEKILSAQGLDKDRLHVIYNSLDYDPMRQYRNQLSAADIVSQRRHFFADEDHDQGALLITSGRLIREKRIDQLLYALKQLNDTSYRLLLVGDGPDRARLMSLTEELCITQQVFFWGPCYDEAVLSRLFSAADLCVVPGDVGLTCIHAMSYGVPCITHDNFNSQKPEFEAIIAGKTGDFFAENDIDALVGKIKEWMAKLKVEKQRDGVENPIRQSCLTVIETKYNPKVQKKLIDSAVAYTHGKDRHTEKSKAARSW